MSQSWLQGFTFYETKPELPGVSDLIESLDNMSACHAPYSSSSSFDEFTMLTLTVSAELTHRLSEKTVLAREIQEAIFQGSQRDRTICCTKSIRE